MRVFHGDGVRIAYDFGDIIDDHARDPHVHNGLACCSWSFRRDDAEHKWRRYPSRPI